MALNSLFYADVKVKA